MRQRLSLGQWSVLTLVLIVGTVYLLNASWLAPSRDGDVFLLAHRGLGQPYERMGLTGQTCTAARSRVSDHTFLENSLPSIERAVQLGAQVVEFDVQPTSDGRFVAFHDATLACRTDGAGRPSDHSLAALQQLDIGHGYTTDGGLHPRRRGIELRT